MILAAQDIRGRPGLIEPFDERSTANGLSYGLGPAGYDVRIAETITLYPVCLSTLIVNALHWRFPSLVKKRPTFIKASTIERFHNPTDLTFKVEDKSTHARVGISLLNTTAEPNWRGWLTLEIKNLSDDEVVTLQAGTPIAQVCFHLLTQPTDTPYTGKYQNQQAGPQPAILEVK